jgi:hypothetical protein
MLKKFWLGLKSKIKYLTETDNYQEFSGAVEVSSSEIL